MNRDLNPSIIFEDLNGVKCIAVGKHYSNVNCLENNEGVVIYNNPENGIINEYVIKENDTYYFYIEDNAGNKYTKEVVVENIDKKDIEIEVFNGENGNDDLDIEGYKREHKFLVAFDRTSESLSPHVLYKYFFSTEEYSNDESVFDGHLIK